MKAEVDGTPRFGDPSQGSDDKVRGISRGGWIGLGAIQRCGRNNARTRTSDLKCNTGPVKVLKSQKIFHLISAARKCHWRWTIYKRMCPSTSPEASSSLNAQATPLGESGSSIPACRGGSVGLGYRLIRTLVILPATRGIPHDPGLVLLLEGAGTDRNLDVVATNDMWNTITALNPDSRSPAQVGWIPATDWDLLDTNPRLNAAASALRPGRMTHGKREDLSDIPHQWGLYRLHQVSGAVYVGITSDLRNRLRAHARSRRLDLAGGGRVEFALAKVGASWESLCLAEVEHIARMLARGLEVENLTQGANGRPPAWAYNLRF